MKLPTWRQIRNRIPTWERIKGMNTLELTVVAVITPCGVILSPIVIYKSLKWLYLRFMA